MVSLRVNKFLVLCLPLATLLVLVNIPNTSGLHCYVGLCYPDWQDCSIPSDNFQKVVCRDDRRVVCVSKISDMKTDDQLFTTIDGSCGRLKEDSGNRNMCSVLSSEGVDAANQFIKDEEKRTGLDDGGIVMGLKDCTCDTDYCNNLKDPPYPHTKMKMKTTTQKTTTTMAKIQNEEHVEEKRQYSSELSMSTIGALEAIAIVVAIIVATTILILIIRVYLTYRATD